MTVAVERRENKNNFGYRLFCMVAFLVGGIYRGVKRTVKGRCGKKMKMVFSGLAVACLMLVFYLCSLLEQDRISLFSAILLVVPSLAGFGMFCDFAGAFCPYRYMKKQGNRQARNRNIMQMPSAETYSATLRKSA